MTKFPLFLVFYFFFVVYCRDTAMGFNVGTYYILYLYIELWVTFDSYYIIITFIIIIIIIII